MAKSKAAAAAPALQGDVPGRLAGKIAVVTGAAGNLGGHIVTHYLAEGATVVMTGRTPDRTKAAADALLKRKIEIYFTDALVAWRLAGQYEAYGLTATTSLLTTESLAWAVRKNDPELLASASAYHQQSRENGEKTLLMRAWLGMYYRPAQ